MRDSSSTDCISSEDASSNNEFFNTPRKSESHLKRSSNKLSSRKLNKTSSISNKILNKIPCENKKEKTETNFKLTFSCRKSLNDITKNFLDFNVNKNNKLEKADILLSNHTERIEFKSEINFSNPFDIPNANKNKFIQKQKLRDELEGNILSLFREKSKQTQQIDKIRDSICSIRNENKKISVMHQRYNIQINSLNNEIKNLKEELIKVIIFLILYY